MFTSGSKGCFLFHCCKAPSEWAVVYGKWALCMGNIVMYTLKAMTHQPTQLFSRVWSGPVGVCVMGLQLDFFLHSSLIPDGLVGSGSTYDSTVEL